MLSSWEIKTQHETDRRGTQKLCSFEGAALSVKNIYALFSLALSLSLRFCVKMKRRKKKKKQPIVFIVVGSLGRMEIRKKVPLNYLMHNNEMSSDIHSLSICTFDFRFHLFRFDSVSIESCRCFSFSLSLSCHFFFCFSSVNENVFMSHCSNGRQSELMLWCYHSFSGIAFDLNMVGWFFPLISVSFALSISCSIRTTEKWVRKCHHIWLHVFDDADDQNEKKKKNIENKSKRICERDNDINIFIWSELAE